MNGDGEIQTNMDAEMETNMDAVMETREVITRVFGDSSDDSEDDVEMDEITSILKQKFLYSVAEW